MTNPLIEMVDVEAISRAIQEGAMACESKPLLVVDNTFMTPYFLVCY